MALSKTITATGSHGHHTFTLTVTETAVNTSANTSTCTVKFTIKPKSTGYNWEDFYGSEKPKGTVTFNGSSYSWELPNYDGKSTVTLVNKTVTVAHASNGTKTVSFSFSCSSGSTSYLPGSASGSGSLTLTAIARYPAVTITNTSKTETAITIKWTSDLTANRVRHRVSTNGGSSWSSWTSQTVSAKSGSYTLSSLTANTTYTIQTEVRSSESGLITTVDKSVKTYAWPYASCPTVSIYKENLTITLVNQLKRSCTVTVKIGSTVIATKSGATESVVLESATYREAFLSTIPSAASGTYTVQVVYSSHTTTKTGTFNATGATPVISSASYQDANTTVQAIIQNDQQLLQNVSTPRFTAAGSGLYGATIASASVTILNTTAALSVSNNTATGTTSVIDSATNVTAKIILTDTRGISASKNITLTMAAYTLPSAVIKLARKNNFYSETDITVDASVMQLGTNVPTITAKWKQTDASTWSNPQTIPDNTPTAINGTTGLDNTEEWNVQVTITDSFGGSVVYNLSVGIGLPIIFFDRRLRAVGVNGFPTSANQLLVNGNISSLPKRFTPTQVSVSGITLNSLQVFVSAGWCAVTIELTSTTTLSGWTTIASGMPLPAMDWYDTMESWATSYKRPFRVQINDANGNLNIRYGGSSSYRISFVYPLADLQ